MNVDASYDYDFIIDGILLSENCTAEKNYIEGIEKSSENSYQQGFQIGYQKGCDIGLEIGFYAGVLIALQKLQNLKIITLTDKELDVFEKLLNIIKFFPRINDTNINTITQYNEIKGLYKKLCFNLKIKNFDKRVLIFQNGTIEI